MVNDRQVQYSNLAPGPYRFRVIACNNSGVWNEQGDTLEFSIAPAYYQTNWFRALCAVPRSGAAVGGLPVTCPAIASSVRDDAGGACRRAHTHCTRASRHAASGRARFAASLPNCFPVAARAADGGERQAGQRHRADRRAVTEGRDAVQGLRDSTTQTNDLALAISTLGEELAADASGHRPVFRVAVEGQSRDLHPILRDEVYKIAAEALRNAFLHANAKQVEVEIRYHDERFRLRVRDDGKGIDAAVLSAQSREGHYGLPGMRERATLIGGKLTIWSEVDAGTEVEVRVPANIAYVTSRKRSWFSRKFAAKAKA